MIGITASGQQRLERTKAQTGSATLKDTMLAALSAKGSMEQADLLSLFSEFPAREQALRELAKDRLVEAK